MPTITALLLFILLVWLATKVLRRIGTTSGAGASARYITIEPNGTSFAVWRMGRSIPERIYHPNMPIVTASIQGKHAVVNFARGKVRLYNLNTGSYTQMR